MPDREPAEPDTSSTIAPEAARAKLASALRTSGRTLSRSAQDAFAQVPRHVFVPEVGPSEAYLDDAIVIKCGSDGLPISSSSQPAMMAIMLEQLGLEPGHRVLEIGTGSGYNAAVMSVVVGRRGKVVSVDIDPELVARARSSLTAAGYQAVTVRCADGGYGDPAGAPFDRIIVTAGAWDIAPAWFEQLAPRGRLVLPLSVRGIQLSVALERSGECWVSRSACRCGFVRMLGAFAGPESVLQVGDGHPMYIQPADGSPVDSAALRTALAGPAEDVPVRIRLGDEIALSDLDLWLTLTQADLDRITLLAAPGGWLPLQGLLPFGGLVSEPTDSGRLGVAMLLPAAAVSDDQDDEHSAVLRGYGPGGPVLAARLAEQAVAWHELGRPGTLDLRLCVQPPGSVVPETAAHAVLERPNALIEVGWR